MEKNEFNYSSGLAEIAYYIEQAILECDRESIPFDGKVEHKVDNVEESYIFTKQETPVVDKGTANTFDVEITIAKYQGLDKSFDYIESVVVSCKGIMLCSFTHAGSPQVFEAAKEGYDRYLSKIVSQTDKQQSSIIIT